ncbi:hypothetical protein HDU89_002108 [Geranomyces variabilis]|nr:hypothetical protein HDU89_002108 [Geranomyces variabilis]
MIIIAADLARRSLFEEVYAREPNPKELDKANADFMGSPPEKAKAVFTRLPDIECHRVD